MAEVGTAFVTLLPSAKGFGRATEKQVGGEMGSAGKSVGSKFGSAIKVGALAGGTALALFGKSIITAGSDAQQSIGATGTVFGKFADDVTKTSSKAAQSYGLSANTYRENANLIGSLFKNQGVATEELAGKTESMIGVGADLAATFGGTTTEAVQTLGAAFKGEYDSIERYGISLKDSTVSALLAKRGQDNLTGSALAAAKQQAVTDLIMQQSKDSLGAFGRESNTLAGQQQRLGASFDNIKATLGTALLPVLTRFVGFLNGSIVPAISTFIAGMRSGAGVGGQFAAAFGTVGAVLGAAFGFIDRYRTALTALGAAIAAVVVVTQIHTAVLAVQAAGGLAAMIRGLPVVTALTRAWAAVQWVLNAALSANPIGLVVVGLVALAAGLVFAYKKSETFRNIVNAAFAAIKVVVSAVVGWFAKYVPQVFSAVASAVRTYVNVYKTVVTAAFNAIRAVVSAVMGFFGSFIRNQIAVARAAFELVKSALTAAGRGFVEFASTVRAKVAEAVGYVRDIPGKVTAALGNLGSLLYNAGAELIQGLINGITSKLAALGSKMSEVAGKIKGFLPGSPVKTGPLTSWNNGGAGKRLMGLLADGITAGGADVEAATARVAGSAAALGGVAPLSGSFAGVSSRSGRSAVGDSPLAVLHRIEAAISRQGREFGREINGAAAAGHKGRVA